MTRVRDHLVVRVATPADAPAIQAIYAPWWSRP